VETSRVTAATMWRPGERTPLEDLRALAAELAPTAPARPVAARPRYEFDVSRCQDEGLRRAHPGRLARVVYSDGVTPSGRAENERRYARLVEASIRDERNALTDAVDRIAAETGLHPDDVLRALGKS
jgi:hypothetical protein